MENTETKRSEKRTAIILSMLMLTVTLVALAPTTSADPIIEEEVRLGSHCDDSGTSSLCIGTQAAEPFDGDVGMTIIISDASADITLGPDDDDDDDRSPCRPHCVVLEASMGPDDDDDDDRSPCRPHCVVLEASMGPDDDDDDDRSPCRPHCRLLEL